MAAAKKPTKQQIAQAKARAGGNNPVKVTNSGLKKLGQAAITAATFTPVGRVARVATTAAKAIKAETTMAKAGWNSAAKANYRAQVKREADAIAKNSVKTKPAAKQVGNPPNNTKAWEDYIGSVSRGAPGRGPAGKAKATRVANSKVAKKEVPSAKEPARIPEVPARGTVRINSAKTVRVVKVSPKKK